MLKMNRIYVSVFLVAGVFASQCAIASEGIAKDNGCMTCHAVDKKIVGPSYKDISKKHAEDKLAAAKLADRIRNGSKGEWGMVPMPPSKVSEADAKALANWVLSVK